MDSPKDDHPRRPGLLSLAVGMCFFALYLLSYSGTFRNSADEWFMFAVTESLARHGQFTVNQMLWVGDYNGWARFGVDGQLYVPYTNFSLGQSLLGVPFYWFAGMVPGAGLAQGALLANVAVTSATLALLLRFLLEPRFSPRASLATVALMGTGSLLWPYSGTYLGEPLLGLAFLSTFYALWRWSRSREGTEGRRSSGRPAAVWAWAVGVALALALVAKPTGVLVAPFAAGLVLASGWRRRPSVAELSGLLSPPMLVGAVIVATNAVWFGPEAGFRHANSFSTPLEVGLYGLLLSPGRGLFVYSPVALLAVPGFALLWRRHRLLAGTVAGFLLAYLLFFALWSDWYGGRINWGPRMLVPILPLMGLGVAAAVDVLGRRRWGLLAVAALGTLGALAQLPAVANNYLEVMRNLIERYPAYIDREPQEAARSFFDWAESPILHQWRELSPGKSEVAWLAIADGPDYAALGLSVGLLALCVLSAIAVYQQRRWATRPATLVVLGAVGAATVAVLLPRYADHSYYGPTELRRAVEAFVREAPPDAALVTLDSETHVPFNYQRGPHLRYGFSGQQARSEVSPAAARRVAAVADRHGEVWLIRTLPKISGAEEILTERLPLVEEARFGEVALLRARPLYAAPPPAAGTPSVRYGGEIELVAAQIGGADGPGSPIRVDLYWRARRPVSERYTVSLQLIAPGGRLAAQHDSPPAAGLLPTDSWEPERTVLDPRSLRTPHEVEPGIYRLIVVLYDGQTGRRLPVDDGSDHAIIGTIHPVRPGAWEPG